MLIQLVLQITTLLMEGTSPSTASFTISGNTASQNDLPLITVDISELLHTQSCKFHFSHSNGVWLSMQVHQMNVQTAQMVSLAWIGF